MAMASVCKYGGKESEISQRRRRSKTWLIPRCCLLLQEEMSTAQRRGADHSHAAHRLQQESQGFRDDLGWALPRGHRCW